MKKVWVYKRAGIKGWWVGWYESGKRKAKALPTRKLAEHYCQLKYSQLNSDVFTGIVTISWKQMIEEYREAKKVQGVTEATLYETALTLRHFERLIGKCNSKQIAQNSIDKFVLQRGKEIKRTTLNKDIRNLRTFINWCREKRYLNGSIKIRELKEDERPVKSLNNAQVKKLMSVAVMTELSRYVCELDPGQEKLFNDNFSYRRWRKICKEAGLSDLKFHDLRKTFGSILAQNGVSTAVTQKLLEHSSSRLTNKIYTNVDPVLRTAVEQLPVGDWL